MVYCVKVSEDADRAGKGAQEEIKRSPFRNAYSFAAVVADVAQSSAQRNQKGNCVSEKSLLHKMNVAGQPHKNGHERKEKCRADYKKDSLCGI